MSLEATIAELNANIKTLIGVLGANQNVTKPAPVKTSEPAPAAPVKASEPAPAPAAAGALDYEKDVKPLVLKVSSTKGRDACTALLGKFSLASAKAAVPAQYADIIAACQEALK